MARGGGIGRPAFTLIEVTAVLALMAVLAGTAALMLAGPRRRAVAADAVAQMAFADVQVRQAAMAGDRSQSLVIDLAAGRLSRAADDSGAVTLADLPAGVRVRRVLMAAEATDYGRVQVPVSPAGRSQSYAVGLETPAGERWVVVAGLTGQPTIEPDEAAADAALGVARAAE